MHNRDVKSILKNWKRVHLLKKPRRILECAVSIQLSPFRRNQSQVICSCDHDDVICHVANYTARGSWQVFQCRDAFCFWFRMVRQHFAFGAICILPKIAEITINDLITVDFFQRWCDVRLKSHLCGSMGAPVRPVTPARGGQPPPPSAPIIPLAAGTLGYPVSRSGCWGTRWRRVVRNSGRTDEVSRR